MEGGGRRGREGGGRGKEGGGKEGEKGFERGRCSSVGSWFVASSSVCQIGPSSLQLKLYYVTGDLVFHMS